MKPLERWPLHPAPLDDEPLSSWLRRIATDYGMTVGQLIHHGLGHDAKVEQDLDRDPPRALLEQLAQRTGLGRDRVREMCLGGWTPWLLDSLEPHPDAFDTYVRQFSVLLRPGRRSKHRPGSWVAWTTREGVQRACPRCVEDPGHPVLRWLWQLPLTLSCPEHGVTLKSCIGVPGEYFAWTSDEATPGTASEAVLAMDRRTEQALFAGQVQLPGRTVHAGVWFRLLRTLLDEVSTPVTYWAPRAGDLSLIWDRSGHPIRAGQSMWRAYEAFSWPTQARLLEATAHAIALLEDGTVLGRGTHARLFFPVYEPVDDGHPPSPPARSAWDEVQVALHDAVQAARNDPAEAQALCEFLVAPRHTSESCRQARALLIELDIPTVRLSSKPDMMPFL